MSTYRLLYGACVQYMPLARKRPSPDRFAQWLTSKSVALLAGQTAAVCLSAPSPQVSPIASGGLYCEKLYKVKAGATLPVTPAKKTLYNFY